MKTFTLVFNRLATVDVEAKDGDEAKQIAERMLDDEVYELDWTDADVDNIEEHTLDLDDIVVGEIYRFRKVKEIKSALHGIKVRVVSKGDASQNLFSCSVELLESARKFEKGTIISTFPDVLEIIEEDV